MENFLPGLSHQWSPNTCLRVFCLLPQTKFGRLGSEVFCHTQAYVCLLNMYLRYSEMWPTELSRVAFCGKD